MVERKTAPPPPAVQAGDKYIVRFPDGMRERVAAAAKENNRSMNAEIVERLDRSFSPQETFATREQVDRLLKVVTQQHETVKMLGSALQAVSEAPVDGRTPFGQSVAAKFAAVGGLFSEGKMGEGFVAFHELNKGMREWSDTPEGKEAIEVDRKRFGEPKSGRALPRPDDPNAPSK